MRMALSPCPSTSLRKTPAPGIRRPMRPAFTLEPGAFEKREESDRRQNPRWESYIPKR